MLAKSPDVRKDGLREGQAAGQRGALNSPGVALGGSKLFKPHPQSADHNTALLVQGEADQSDAAGALSLARRAASSGYITNPPLAELATWSPDELRSVHDFKVVRSGVGGVRFFDPVDLSGLLTPSDADLLKQVRFFRDDTTGNPNLDLSVEGSQLHQLSALGRAEITFEAVMRRQDGEEETDTHLRMKYEAFLFKRNKKKDCKQETVAYDVDTNTWTFRNRE